MSESSLLKRFVTTGGATAVVLLLSLGAADKAFSDPGSPGSSPGIYHCKSKAILSDRPAADCPGGDDVLGPDGAKVGEWQPALTEDERLDKERKDREAADAIRKAQAAVKADADLLRKYPGPAELEQARSRELDRPRAAVVRLQEKVEQLNADRKGLTDEAEFYRNKALPAKLQSAFDANDALLAAQKSLIQKQQDEMALTNQRYDSELTHLRQLWTETRSADAAATAQNPQKGARTLK